MLWNKNSNNNDIHHTQNTIYCQSGLLTYLTSFKTIYHAHLTLTKQTVNFYTSNSTA